MAAGSARRSVSITSPVFSWMQVSVAAMAMQSFHGEAPLQPVVLAAPLLLVAVPALRALRCSPSTAVVGGTLFGSMLLGLINKGPEPYAGAVLGKIFVLVAIILFIQRRPRGLFALKGRAVEA